MRTGLEIRPPKLYNLQVSVLIREFEMNNAIGITRALNTVGGNHECRTMVSCELKKRLCQTAMVKRICGEIAELTETVHKDPCRLPLVYRVGHLRCNRPPFYFSWRKNVVELILCKRLWRRSEVQYLRELQVEAYRFGIRKDMVRRLSESNH